ncbi:MAG: dodecin domain-containing protein [Nitrosomonas sp.]|nr:dodecin domain-containing protein [Nitrosomonas sp.]MBK7365549.1 dodecin domain-containing protein [Nitrosomonas sp.]
MSIAKVFEIISSSKVSFDDAIKKGIARAADTMTDITSAWVKDQYVEVSDGKVVEYRVVLKITFILKSAPKATTSKTKAKATK